MPKTFRSIRKRRFIISHSLKILRAFIDSMQTEGNSLYVSVAYRRGRVFCRFDSDYRLLFRVEEKNLALKGFGDFKSFRVSQDGNMILFGALQPDRVSIFTLNQKGKLISSRFISGCPLMESADCDREGNLFIHSPLMEHPFYEFDSCLRIKGPVGSHGENETNTMNRIGRILACENGSLIFARENLPARLTGYSKEGKQQFDINMDMESDSPDLIGHVLDMSLQADTGNIMVLTAPIENRLRSIRIFSPLGKQIATATVPAGVRRIHSLQKDRLLTSETIFGTAGIFLAGGLYGAITTLDEYDLKE